MEERFEKRLSIYCKFTGTFHVTFTADTCQLSL